VLRALIYIKEGEGDIMVRSLVRLRQSLGLLVSSGHYLFKYILNIKIQIERKKDTIQIALQKWIIGSILLHLYCVSIM